VRAQPLKAILHDGALDLPSQSIDRPQRIVQGMAALGRQQASLLLHSRRAEPEELERVHSSEYVHGLREICRDLPQAQLDPELIVEPRSYDVAACAAGALIDAACTASPHKPPTVCLSRPGSHHAGRDYGMGFCLFNNLAAGAAAALATGRAERVAILDFDAHHGNGTEQIFWEDERVLTVSLHQFPFFPGTGAADDTGPSGTNINLPMPAGATGSEACAAYRQAIGAIRRHRPQLVLVEAGVDGHREDWTSDLEIDDGAYRLFGQLLRQLCEEITAALVIEMGGGYTEAAVMGGFAAFTEGLLR